MKNSVGFIWIGQLEGCLPGSDPLTLSSMAKFGQGLNIAFPRYVWV